MDSLFRRTIKAGIVYPGSSFHLSLTSNVHWKKKGVYHYLTPKPLVYHYLTPKPVSHISLQVGPAEEGVKIIHKTYAKTQGNKMVFIWCKKSSILLPKEGVWDTATEMVLFVGAMPSHLASKGRESCEN